MPKTINQKLLDHQLGGNALISTAEMCAELRNVANGGIDGLHARFLREVAERLEMYQREREVARHVDDDDDEAGI